MNRQQTLDAYDTMRQNIRNEEDKALTQMYTYVKTYFKTIPKDEWSWETFAPILEDMIYESLTVTYKITIQAIKKIYNKTFTDLINKDSLKDLTYSQDGKTLSERLEFHYNRAVQRDNPNDYFYNRLVLIMDTETLYASNHVIHGKLKKYATHAEVFNGNDDICEQHEECEYWSTKGKMPIEELEKLPPYHPDCECEVIYYIDEEKI